MLSGLIREISNNIKPINNDKDDIFIVCASFEERTGAVVERLAEKYRVAKSFIFKYDEKDRTNLRDQNFEKLKNALLLYSENVYPIICDHHDPLDGINKFENLCKNRGVILEDKNITIDITTFTKQYLLVLLKFVEKQTPKIN